MNRVLEKSEGAASSPSVASDRAPPCASENSAYPSTAFTAALDSTTVRSLRNSSGPVTRVTLPNTSTAPLPAIAGKPATGLGQQERGELRPAGPGQSRVRTFTPSPSRSTRTSPSLSVRNIAAPDSASGSIVEGRSEERRVGKEGGSTGRVGWCPFP